MERDVKSRLLYGKMPRDVVDELSPVHIEKTWGLLEEKFSFNVKVWNQEFKAYYQKQPHNVSECEAFVEFGGAFINPVLNTILKRQSHHNTWGNMIIYIVKKH
jgi:hypothetical protein